MRYCHVPCHHWLQLFWLQCHITDYITKDKFLFIFALLHDRYGSIDCSRMEDLQRKACPLIGLALSYVQVSLPKESVCRKLVKSLKFFQPSPTIQNWIKCNMVSNLLSWTVPCIVLDCTFPASCLLWIPWSGALAF